MEKHYIPSDEELRILIRAVREGNMPTTNALLSKCMDPNTIQYYGARCNGLLKTKQS